MEPKNFQDLLDQNHTWPSQFLFKFVVPAKKVDTFLETMNFATDAKIRRKLSKSGNYHSLSIELELESSSEVVAHYQKAGSIEGVICL